jgi:hypothetical protein
MASRAADVVARHIRRATKIVEGSAPRARWPERLYHVTDIRNAVSILKSGAVLSRAAATTQGLAFADAASAAVVENAPWAHDFARLYFRPRTPTQFWMEGMRMPQERGALGALGCIPVFFIFRAAETLLLPGVQLTAGNASNAGVQTYDSIAGLSKLSMERIYHDGRMSQAEKAAVTHARCAEVLVPEQLGLQSLEAVVCRSVPEYDTLMFRLRGSAHEAARRLVRLEEPGEGLFNKLHTYVQGVKLLGDRILLEFVNPEGRTFDAKLRVSRAADGVAVLEQDRPSFTPQRRIEARLPSPEERVRVKLMMDHYLACDVIASARKLF